jgi:cell division protease FtsH
VKKLVQGGYDRARKIIEEKSEALTRIALALLEREVLDGTEVRQLIEGQPLPAFNNPRPPAAPGDAQQVLKPEPGRRVPGMLEGGPQPA